MPFIGYEPPKEICTSPEHNPPSHIVLRDGVYKWQCPACGQVTTWVVSSPTFTTGTTGGLGCSSSGLFMWLDS